MKYTRLGRSGLDVSRVCLGCMGFGEGSPGRQDWAVGEAESREMIATALDLGINFFDTANAYSAGSSEEIVGRALRDMTNRDNVVIATKVFFPMSKDPNDRGLSRKHILASCDASLRRLGTDYIDLYQIHRWDPVTPIEETLEALDSLVRAGKVRYLGASSMFAWQLAKALFTADANGWHRFVAMQNHYNLMYREEEREMLPLCRDQGLGVIPWSPLARGWLAGTRTRDGEPKTARAQSDDYSERMYADGEFDIVDRVVEVAKGKGVSPAAVAYAWILAQPGVTGPIVGATKVTHLEAAVAAVDVTLTDDECARLEEPYAPRPLLGHTPQPVGRGRVAR